MKKPILGTKEAPLDARTPVEQTQDKTVLVVNLKTGTIKEIPCGPMNAGHMSGDMCLVYVKELHRAVVPKRWQGLGHKKILDGQKPKFRRYDELCSDPILNERHGLSEAEGRGYFSKYLAYVAERGRGSAFNPDVAKPLTHPALGGLKPNLVTPAKSVKDKHVAQLEAELEAIKGQLPDMVAKAVARSKDKG